MVVQPLRHQLHCQVVLQSARFLDLRSLVLKPDFDLRLAETEFFGQISPSLLGQVVALLELLLQSLQLGGAEGRTRALFVFRFLSPLHLSYPGPCRNDKIITLF